VKENNLDTGSSLFAANFGDTGSIASYGAWRTVSHRCLIPEK